MSDGREQPALVDCGRVGWGCRRWQTPIIHLFPIIRNPQLDFPKDFRM
jgi:hypothetical protein